MRNKSYRQAKAFIKACWTLSTTAQEIRSPSKLRELVYKRTAIAFYMTESRGISEDHAAHLINRSRFIFRHYETIRHYQEIKDNIEMLKKC